MRNAGKGVPKGLNRRGRHDFHSSFSTVRPIRDEGPGVWDASGDTVQPPVVHIDR